MDPLLLQKNTSKSHFTSSKQDAYVFLISYLLDHSISIKKVKIYLDCKDSIKSLLYTFIAFQSIHVSNPMSCHDQISANQRPLMRFSVSSEFSSLQPAVMIVLSHGEGNATSLCSAVIVTITESLTSEVSYISTPVVDIVLNFG